MYADNELLFPHHIIPSLRKLRGPKWQALVERIISLPECHEETLALMLMMVRLNGCVPCETDSYRAMKGCAACSAQTLRRYKGKDEELLELYQETLLEVQHFAQNNHNRIAIQRGEPVVESHGDNNLSSYTILRPSMG